MRIAVRNRVGKAGFLAAVFLAVGLLVTGDASAQAVGAQDAFADFESIDDSEFSEGIEEGTPSRSQGHRGLYVSLGVLAATALAGVMVRFKYPRYTRTLFLLGSVVVLGFWFGGCPCSISSFQNVLLRAMGKDICVYSIRDRLRRR